MHKLPFHFSLPHCVTENLLEGKLIGVRYLKEKTVCE